MPINLPDGSQPSEIILPDGSSASEVRDPAGNVVWSAHTEYSLNMQDNNDDIDLSAHTAQVATGETFLAWVKYYQIGTADNQNGPGMFAANASGGWNDYCCVGLSGGGTPVTSGSNADTFLRIESAGGQIAYPSSFTYTVGNWALWGFAVNADGTIDWYFNDTKPADNNYNDFAGGEVLNVNYIGPGYAGATNSGIGYKDMARAHVFDHVLTATEASDYYNNGTVPTGEVHGWYLNEGSGTTAGDSAGTADGSIRNATWFQGGPAVIS